MQRNDKIKEKIIISIDVLLKVIVIALISLYIVLYIKGFAIYDYAYAGREGEEDFDLYIGIVLQTLGISFSCALVIFWLLQNRQSLIKRILLVIIAALQLLYIGIPGSENLSLGVKNICGNDKIEYFNWESVNAIGRVIQDRNLAIRYKDVESVEQYNMMINIMQLIQIMTMIVIAFGVIRIFFKKNDEKAVDIKLNEKVTITTVLMNCINLVMVYKLLNLSNTYLYSKFNGRELGDVYRIGFNIGNMASRCIPHLKGITIPLILLQLIVISWFISKKKYLIAGGMYYVQEIICANLLYYIENRRVQGRYRPTLRDADGAGTEYLEHILICGKVFLVIGIVRYTFLLVKYIYKKIKKKDLPRLKMIEFTRRQYNKAKILLVSEVLIGFVGIAFIVKNKLKTFAQITTSEYGDVDMYFNIGETNKYSEYIETVNDSMLTVLLPIMVVVAVGVVVVAFVWKKGLYERWVNRKETI